MGGSVDRRLAELGIVLPVPPAPVAKYVPSVRTGSLLFISGQISRAPFGEAVDGKLGAGLSVADGQRGARLCAINLIAQAQVALGDLDRVVRVVRLNGFVNSAPDFTDHPSVINAASELFAEVFGDRGTHSRCALGVAALPLGAAVEIDAVIEVA